MVLKSRPFGDLLLLSAGLGSAGWIFFILGSLFYVRRCVHTSAVKRMWGAAWSCLWRGSFSENKQSAGGEFSDAEIEDVRMTARLIPIFACLIPLYLGQVQVLTTLRTMGEKLVRPRSFGIHLFMPAELLLLFEPGTSLLVSLFLNYLLYPFLHKTRPRWMPSHLTRLTAGSVLVTLGFAVSFFIQRLLMTSSSSRNNYSIFILAFPVVLFSAGQTLITSSGFELSYAYAPASMWSVSISLFSLIYSLGSLVSVLLIYCMQGQLDRRIKRLDLYFAISAGLCLLSVIGLCCLRSFHARTREMRIERDIERRALEIALRRISVVAK
jgi:dipeptide/tripeptide permease